MYDGTTKKIKDLEIGDEIYGVEQDGFYHKYVKSTVLNKWTTEKPSYKITLENGQELICSGDHRWLSNRGWKYTIGAMTGFDRRPYLTDRNSLMGFWSIIDTDTMEETDMYKKGYLSGVIRGDGSLSVHDYTGRRENRNKEIQYCFRLAMKDEQAVKRAKEYLRHFGVHTDEFVFQMIDRHTKETIDTIAIRTRKRENYERIKELIAYNGDKEYMRGFLAGIYDAEGCSNQNIKRLYNCDSEIIDTIESGLKEFCFSYKFDKNSHRPSGKVLRTIRLLGGNSEFLRFYQTTQPAIDRKFDLTNVALKNSTIKIMSIEPFKEKQKLYDITTSTENFIANGVVSHNCYAKSLLDFRKLWNAQHPSVTSPEELRKEVRKLKKGDVVRLGGMTDCFQPMERTHRSTYNLIKMLNKRGIHYLIVTKSHMVADPEYLEIMDKDLAHIQITVTTTDDKLSLTYEKASVPSKRIAAIEKLQAHGFDVQLRLSPFIPQYIDFDKLNSVKCDKILVEFLRVNTWIRRWFDIDYSEHTVNHSGYHHLPLKKKKEYISRITGFKEMTVCEDVTAHHQYWKNNFNHNPDDCCNLSFRERKENV